MNKPEYRIEFKFESSSIALVKLLREHTRFSISEVKSHLEQKEKIDIISMCEFGSEGESRFQALMAKLEVMGVKYEVFVGGQSRTKEFLLNSIARWHELSDEQEMIVDLEIGEPSIETLTAARRRMPEETYKETLLLVTNNRSYQASPDTLSWAREEYQKLYKE